MGGFQVDSDWAVRVRYQKKAGKLSEERMMAFKKDGFQWEYKFDCSNKKRIYKI